MKNKIVITKKINGLSHDEIIQSCAMNPNIEVEKTNEASVYDIGGNEASDFFDAGFLIAHKTANNIGTIYYIIHSDTAQLSAISQAYITHFAKTIDLLQRMKEGKITIAECDAEIRALNKGIIIPYTQ